MQLLLTAAVVFKVHAIPSFFTTTHAGLGLYIFLIILPFIGQSPIPFGYSRFRLFSMWIVLHRIGGEGITASPASRGVSVNALFGHSCPSNEANNLVFLNNSQNLVGVFMPF